MLYIFAQMADNKNERTPYHTVSVKWCGKIGKIVLFCFWYDDDGGSGTLCWMSFKVFNVFAPFQMWHRKWARRSRTIPFYYIYVISHQYIVTFVCHSTNQHKTITILIIMKIIHFKITSTWNDSTACPCFY